MLRRNKHQTICLEKNLASSRASRNLEFQLLKMKLTEKDKEIPVKVDFDRISVRTEFYIPPVNYCLQLHSFRIPQRKRKIQNPSLNIGLKVLNISRILLKLAIIEEQWQFIPLFFKMECVPTHTEAELKFSKPMVIAGQCNSTVIYSHYR